MTAIGWNDWSQVLPALSLILGGLAVAGTAGLSKREGRQAAGEYIAYLALAAALILSIVPLYSGKTPAPAFRGAVTLDALACFLSVAIIVATGLMLVLSADTIRQKGVAAGEYGALVLLAAAGMVLLVQSLDLIAFFVSLEVLSLSVYALTGFFRRDPRSNEASVKYFVMGAFATGFLLYGMALLYGATGAVSLSGIGEALRGGKGEALALLGFTMLTIGVCFKIGAAPFHMWVPDVYEGAPTAVTAFMSVAVKAAAFGAFLRLLLSTGLPLDGWGTPVAEMLAGAALLTLVVGNLLAMWQRSVKRMLAYSSIAHTGYLLVGLASLRGGGMREAASGTVFYLVAYTFMTLGAFAFVVCAGRGGKDAEDLEDYAGLAKRRPWLALAMTVFMVSLSGLPPTAGFFGKFLIFKAAVASHQYLLVIVGVLGSAVSVYYYLRVVVYMYMHPEGAPTDEAPASNVAVVVLMAALFTALMGVLPSNFLALSIQSLRPLLPTF